MIASSMLRQFIQTKQTTLTKRSHRTYCEVIELFEDYLRLLELPEPNTEPRNLDPVLTALDNFMDDHLISSLGAERDFLRSAELVIRDLRKWLRGQRKLPKADPSTSMAIGA